MILTFGDGSVTARLSHALLVLNCAMRLTGRTRGVEVRGQAGCQVQRPVVGESNAAHRIEVKPPQGLRTSPQQVHTGAAMPGTAGDRAPISRFAVSPSTASMQCSMHEQGP